MEKWGPPPHPVDRRRALVGSRARGMVPLSCADGRGMMELPTAARWTQCKALKLAGAHQPVLSATRRRYRRERAKAAADWYAHVPWCCKQQHRYKQALEIEWSECSYLGIIARWLFPFTTTYQIAMHMHVVESSTVARARGLPSRRLRTRSAHSTLRCTPLFLPAHPVPY